MLGKIGTLLLFTSCLIAQERTFEGEKIKTPEEIQVELDQAQRDFEYAKSLFIPWYTGPLITGSANNAPPGVWNIQPYLYFETAYAQFNNDRKSIGIDDIFTINPLFLVQRGLTHWLDATLIIKGFFRWQDGLNAQGYGDMTVNFGLQVIKQTPWVPSVRITVGESFPTGRYKDLPPSKSSIASTGSGAFATKLGLNVSKVFWTIPLHPVSLRFSGSYTIPNHQVEVTGFNAYGGGFGTQGDVCKGQSLELDLGVEVSLTQKWVFAFDTVFALGFSSSFVGTPGIDQMGNPASVGGSSSDQLSFAPAIEYNVSEKGGFIGGVWFTVTGRNSSNFVTAVLSYTHSF